MSTRRSRVTALLTYAERYARRSPASSDTTNAIAEHDENLHDLTEVCDRRMMASSNMSPHREREHGRERQTEQHVDEDLELAASVGSQVPDGQL